MPRYQKKSHLTLYKKGHRKRKFLTSPSPFKSQKRQCQQNSPYSFNKFHHFLSPSKSNDKTFSPSPMIVQILQSPTVTVSNKVSKRKLHFEQDTSNTVTELEETTTLLKQLLDAGSFSTNNIAFKLFQDTLKWHSCPNTSGMRYSDEVKEFFWTGRRLLGDQFLRFMRGFAHKGLVVQGSMNKGNYDPLQTNINFAVPSERTLDDYQPSDIAFNKCLEPGIIQTNVDLYAAAYPGVSCVVMFDGKKIVPNSADVYLLDKEEDPKLSDIRKKFENRCVFIDNLVEKLEVLNEQGCQNIKDIPHTDREASVNVCTSVLEEIGNVTKSLRQTYAKKKVYVNTLERKFKDTSDGKFKYALNKVRTLQYQLSICVKDLLDVVNVILRCCAVLNGKEHLFSQNICCLNFQDNYKELKQPADIVGSCGIASVESIPSHILKQRTEEWFKLRKTVNVTGSVIHKALGMETLAAQREYYDAVICGKEAPEVNTIQREAMKHGSENELNAVATFVSKVMPTYFPNYTFYEEGAYVIKNDQDRNILVVSPDGSLRDHARKPVISIEMKCPYSVYSGSTPVYYEMKPRHVIQNLAELDVLRAEEHVYVSWSKESTTVFKMSKNDALFERVVKEVNDMYYKDIPRRPTKISPTVKELKTDIINESLKASFLCEVPSITAKLDLDRNDTPDSPYYASKRSLASTEEEKLAVTDVIQSLYKGKKLIMDAFELQKPISSEVLIHLISDMDRTWKMEVGHGLPISFLFKGYSLSMATSRRILNEVLDACTVSGLHVPCVAFDGQFSQLKDFDDNGNTLTLFSFQRQFWSKIRKLSKRELIAAVNDLFMEYVVFREQETEVDDESGVVFRPGSYIVRNKNPDIKPIATEIDIIKKRIVIQAEISDDREVTDCNGLDENVVQILKDVIEPIDGCISTEPRYTINLDETDAQNGLADAVDNPVDKFTLQDEDYGVIYKLLCSSKRSKKWNLRCIEDLENIFASASSINKELTGQELHEIVNYINIKLTAKALSIKQSLRKAEKVNCLCDILGKSSKITTCAKVRRTRKIKTLKALCITEIQKRTYPKDAIAVACAKSRWPAEEKAWYESQNTLVSREMDINSETDPVQTLTFNPVYSPEYNCKRRQHEVRIMDGTHIRTNIKSKLIRSNLGNVRINGWKTVAISGKTELAPAMLEVQNDGKIMHQQSDPYVRTMFCKEVEDELTHNGNFEEARFCKLFREWHEAEDKAGIAAIERCLRSLRLRDWLLEDYSFGNFPPKTQYVKGIPRVTFEGLVCSIDAHLLLYGLTKSGTYNWRSASTLVAENFMGELAERSQNNHGVPSGRCLPGDMTKISELHAMRLKPNRPFQMKTSKTRAYAVPSGLKGGCNFEQNDHEHTVNVDKASPTDSAFISATGLKMYSLTIRNHEFDVRQSGKPKKGTVRKFGEHPRGVQSVRAHYKVDESKILPSLSLGLTEEIVLSQCKYRGANVQLCVFCVYRACIIHSGCVYHSFMVRAFNVYHSDHSSCKRIIHCVHCVHRMIHDVNDVRDNAFRL